MGHSLVREVVEYTAGKFKLFVGTSALMAFPPGEQVTEKVPGDDFQALEEKIYRTIALFKAEREARDAAERESSRLREQVQERDEQISTLRREAVQLRKEREEIRGRVEKMLEQIDSIAEVRAS